MPDWEEVGSAQNPPWEGNVEDGLVAGSQILSLTLAGSHSRHQVFPLNLCHLS